VSTALVAEDQLDLIFHALANRTRRALLARLKRGPAKVTDLAEPFGVSLNAVSKHLLVLEDAGLVERTIKGRIHLCALQAGPMASAEAWIGTYEGFWGGTLEKLADFVENNMDQA
jgi:DNA-binding transcriptional ArsR family regulator